MHIPAGTTDTCAVLSFSDALKNALLPNDGYDVNRWLYVPNIYDEYRYILGTRGLRPVICIGINPSTAAPDALDNTLKSVERVAHFNGYDSFFMYNIYAQRATDPDDMERCFNPYLHTQNLEAFEYALTEEEKRGRIPVVWAAWGTIIEKRRFLLDCMEDFLSAAERHGAAWVTAGKRSAAKGHPHHPLYLAKNSVFEPFDAAAYAKALRG